MMAAIENSRKSESKRSKDGTEKKAMQPMPAKANGVSSKWVMPEDWEMRVLGEVFDFVSTSSFSRDNLTNEETTNKVHNIHYGDIHAKFNSELLDFDSAEVPFLKDEFYSENFLFLKEGDLVIADASEDYEGIAAAVEVKNIRDKKIIGGLHTIVIRDNKNQTAKGFRTYLFKNNNIHNELKKIATGISVYGISKGNLSKIKIPLPPLPEQKAIARVLSTWDEAIHKTERLIVQKELRKKWLMQQFFRYERGDMRHEMKQVGFHDAFQILRSFSVSRDGLITTDKEDSIFCIHYGDIHALYENQFLDFSRQIGIPKLKENIPVHENDFLQEGDIIMADASEDYEGVGEIVEVVNLQSRKAIGGLHTIVLRPNSNIFSPKYTGYLLSSQQIKNELRRKATGTSVYSVSKATLHNSSLIIHRSLKEQTRIANILQTADKEINLLKSKAEKLREQKKGLMQQLLTGKKRLKIYVK